MKTIISKLIPKPWGILCVLCMCTGSCSLPERDETKTLQEGSGVSVTIELGAIVRKVRGDAKDTDLTSSQVIPKGSSISSIDSQPKVMSIGDSNSIIAYLYTEYDDKDYQDNDLKNGDKFRVVAYRKSDGSYYVHKDYTVGMPYEKLELVRDEEYSIIAYSFGDDKELPVFNKSYIDNAKVELGKYNGQLEYYHQKQDFTPVDSSNKNILKINLVDKSSYLNIVFRSLGSNIPIDNAIIKINLNRLPFGVAEINSNTGEISCVSECSENSEVIANVGKNANNSYSSSFFVSNDSERVSLNAIVRILDSDEYFKNINFDVYKEMRTTVFVDFRVCGAYTDASKSIFKRFMCNDLGGELINPNQNLVRKEQNGDMYVWGIESPIISRQYYQELSENNVTKFDWWSETVKNEKDLRTVHGFNGVCPKGWHVPWREEWGGVMDNNSLKDLVIKEENFTMGIRIGENLLLPMSGFIMESGYNWLPIVKAEGRDWIPGDLKSANRWVFEDALGKNTIGRNDERSLLSMFFRDKENSSIFDVSKYRGIPVRCAKD